MFNQLIFGLRPLHALLRTISVVAYITLVLIAPAVVAASEMENAYTANYRNVIKLHELVNDLAEKEQRDKGANALDEMRLNLDYLDDRIRRSSRNLDEPDQKRLEKPMEIAFRSSKDLRVAAGVFQTVLRKVHTKYDSELRAFNNRFKKFDSEMKKFWKVLTQYGRELKNRAETFHGEWRS